MKKLITVAVAGFFAFHASAGRIRTLEIINFDLVYQPQGIATDTTISSADLNNILRGNISATNILYGLGKNIPVYFGNVTNYIHTELEGKPARITSKDIIKLIGAAFETNFPAGSQLAFAGEEIVIVDSTGANVIFFPDENTPPNSSESGFTLTRDEGIGWGADVRNSLGDENRDFTYRYIIHINLYNYPRTEVPSMESISITNSFDLRLGGLVTENDTFTYDHTNYTWVEKISSKLTGVAGEGWIGDQYGILDGSAKGHGSTRSRRE